MIQSLPVLRFRPQFIVLSPNYVFIYLFFYVCLLIITLNDYIYNTTKTKTKQKSALTREININKVKQINCQINIGLKEIIKKYNRAMK